MRGLAFNFTRQCASIGLAAASERGVRADGCQLGAGRDSEQNRQARRDRIAAEALRPVAPDGVAEGVVEGALDGIVEVERSTFLRRRKAQRLPLEPQNSLRKGMFDLRFAVFVTPAQNPRIVLESRHFSSRWLYLTLGVVLVAGLVAGLGGIILRST